LASNAETEISRVGVHKARRNSPKAAVTVDEAYALGTHHFRGLLNYFGQVFSADIVWMISVKIDFNFAILNDGGHWSCRNFGDEHERIPSRASKPRDFRVIIRSGGCTNAHRRSPPLGAPALLTRWPSMAEANVSM
jgi:hypothetical protein